MQLCYAPFSPCSQKVRLVLEEKGLAYDLRFIDLGGKENLRPAYLALNPKGVIPTLIDDDRAVTESSVIAEYLDDRYPTPALRPEDAHERAGMRLWMRAVDEQWHPANGALAWPFLARPGFLKKPESEAVALIEKTKDPTRRARQLRLYKEGSAAEDVGAAIGTIVELVAQMNKTLSSGQPYVAGARLSLADLCITPYVQSLYQFGLWPWVQPRFSHVSRWFEAMQARASYKNAIAAAAPAEMYARLKALSDEAWLHIHRHLERSEPPSS